jgi:hypothetical protein
LTLTADNTFGVKAPNVAVRMLSKARTSIAALSLAAVIGLSGCGSSEQDSLSNFLDGVGRLPGRAVAIGEDGSVNVPFPQFDGTVLGADAKGNRLLLIGDSIFAGAAPRYGNDLCRALVPLGWQVAVEAEANQQIRFGREVLTARLSEGWDAAVVFLGTNFNGNFPNYQSDLDRILTSLAPRPTLVLTTSLFREVQQQINSVIQSVAATHPHVRILDWTTISAYDGVLSPDRVHPSVEGRAILAQAISQAAGVAPTSPGDCLESQFTNDQLDDVEPQDTVAPETDPEPIPAAPPASTSPTTTPPTTVPPTSVPATPTAN